MLKIIKIQLLVSFLFFILIAVYSEKSIAISPSLRFQHLTIDDGLPQNSILTIAQDSSGFLWFGTEDGLTRFDGYDFKIYKHDEDNINSLSHSYISKVVADKEGILWIGTRGGGLNSFDTKTEQFTQYRVSSDNGITHDSIHSIIKDSKGNLWVGTLGGGLSYFDTQSKQFKHYQHHANNPSSLSDNNIFSIAEDEKGNLWVGTGNGLNYLNIVTGQFTHFKHHVDGKTTLSSDEVYSLTVDNKNNLWIGTRGGGLNYLDTTSKKFTRYLHQPDNLNSLSQNTVYAILEDNKGNLWLGTGDGGLNYFDLKKSKFTHYRHQSNDPNSLSHDTVFSLAEDAQGSIWIGLVGGGLNYINSNTEKFGYYRHRANDASSLSHDNVFSILEDSQGDFWVGTRGGGLNYFNTKNEQLTHYLYQQGDPNSLSHNSVYVLEEDKKGNLWIGTGSSGLNYLNRKTGQFIHYQHQPDNPNSLINNTIFALAIDAKNNLWIGTPNGISYFDSELEQFTHYRKQTENLNSLSDNTAYTLMLNSEGNLWIGTPNGLNFYDIRNQKFTHYRHQNSNTNSISNDTVYTILEDSQQNVWIGTGGGGLNRFNKKTLQFTHYNTKHGLPNNVIYGIEEDDQGFIWVSTNLGLSRMNPTTKEFINYDLGDGLQSNEFNIGASFKGKSGALFFGGINGFNRFFPEQITAYEQPLKVALTDMLLLNKSVTIGSNKTQVSRHEFTLDQAIQFTESITLGHQDNVIAFEFSALHFTNPQKNKFAYQLVGWDKTWVHTDYKNRRATYTNLPAGDYTFKVKASNTMDSWQNSNIVSLQITVLPAPWLSWWAYTIYALLLTFLLQMFIRSQRKKVLFEQNLNAQLESKVKQRTIELQDANEHLEQANAQLEELSFTDQLTGLRNRRFLLSNLPSDIELILRKYKSIRLNSKENELTETDLIFFLIDLDNFKKVNDVYGHSAGDTVLLQIKAILEHVFRETDYLVRWGGEEFLVIARFTDRTKAPELAERLRLAIERHSFEVLPDQVISKTCSIGYACFPFLKDAPTCLSWERVIDIADYCLYAAKKSNRNAWVGLENIALDQERAFTKITEQTQVSIELNLLAVKTSIDNKSMIQWD